MAVASGMGVQHFMVFVGDFSAVVGSEACSSRVLEKECSWMD